MKTSVSLILAAGLAAGCTVGPGYERPPISVPGEIRGQAGAAAEASVETPTEAASLADLAWWEIVGDETLEALIAEALENAWDVRLAAWRVEEARAAAGIARAERWPQVSAAAGVSRGRASAFASPVPGTSDLYDVNLGLAWEIDLWGRVRRLNEAALARFLATEEARRGVLLSLVSDVAAAYFELRGLDVQLEIARRTAAAFEQTHALFDHRLEAGLASALETESAAASLAATAATIPDLERRIVAQENRLSLLLGRHPGDVPRGSELTEQLLPPRIPAGLPSQLLERRPDLRRAEQELVAANAEVGVAVAATFPQIRLTGAFGGVAPEVSDLFGAGKSWSAGGGLLTPVFQGKRLKNEREAARARFEQAKVRFEKSVASAFAEVSTALVAYARLADVEAEQARAVAAASQAVDIAGTRYLSGLADYLEVLQARQQLFPAENALARTRFERLATLVELYRALGGGWQLQDAEWTGRVASGGSSETPTASPG